MNVIQKIWREIKRSFRKGLCFCVAKSNTTETIVRDALNRPEFVERLFENPKQFQWFDQNVWNDFFTAKPEDLKKLQNRLTTNMDELSCEVTARFIARRLFCKEYGQMPTLLRESIWNTFFKLLRSVYPLDCEEQERIISLGRAYKCPYKLPYYLTEHKATGYGLNQFSQEDQSRVVGRDIIDGGSCSGDSAMIFTEYDPRKVYAFEPNPDTVPAMKRVIEDNAETLGGRKSLIEIVPLALGKSKGTLTLRSSGEFDLGATASQCPKSNAYEVGVIAVDEFVKENSLNVRLIKLDIEGAEYEAVLGAKETIIMQKPLLLISIYHTFKDFFEIKPLIESWGLGYRFEVRHHHPSIPDSEFVLMAR